MHSKDKLILPSFLSPHLPTNSVLPSRQPREIFSLIYTELTFRMVYNRLSVALICTELTGFEKYMISYSITFA
jgi:hypothetical protein